MSNEGIKFYFSRILLSSCDTLKIAMKKISIVILVGFLALAWLDLYVHQLPRGFCAQKVISSIDLRSEWEIAASKNKEKAKEILSQDFFYLDKGTQAYVFLSQDGQYVLKIFKQHKLHPPSIASSFIHPKKEKYQKKKETFCASLDGCKEAFLKFQEETGLVYLHLNKKPDLSKQVSCFDKKGEKHSIEIDDTVFMLQKKADLIYPTIAKYMTNGHEKEARELISSIFDLLTTFQLRGVYDNDPNLKRNFGVINGTQVIQIDVGTFHVDETKKIENNISYVIAPLKTWIAENYPELSSCIQQPG
jgi:hypothetical protein